MYANCLLPLPKSFRSIRLDLGISERVHVQALICDRKHPVRKVLVLAVAECMSIEFMGTVDAWVTFALSFPS